MKSTAIKHQLPTPLHHISLGKTLVKKSLFFEAFDHFKQSIIENNNYVIDILIYLYKLDITNQYGVNLKIIIAKIYLEIDFIHEAFNIFDEILEEDPRQELVYDELSKLVIKKKLTKRIQQRFELAIKQNIYFKPIITVLPKIYLEQKKFSNAIRLYHHLISISPKEFSYYKILSELYFRKRDYESASNILNDLMKIAPFKSQELLPSIEQIIRKIPRHITIRLLYINILFRSFKPEESCQEIATLIKYHPSKKPDVIQILKDQNHAFPNNPDILYLLSELLIDTKMYTESIEHIQTIIQQHPNYSDKCLLLIQKIIQIYPEHSLALEIIGHIYFQQENFHQAFYYFHKCIDQHDDPIQLGLIELLDPIQSNPKEPTQYKAKLIIAKIHAKANQIEKAMAYIDELSESEESIDASLLKIDIHNKQNNHFLSLNLIHTLLKQHPFHWDIHYASHQSFSSFNQTMLQHLTTTDLNKPLDTINKGIHLISNGSINKAIEMLQKISTSDQYYDKAQRLISRCYFEQSRFDLSNQILKRTIKHLTNSADIKACHYWIGLSQLLLSDHAHAIESFEIIETYDRNYLNTQSILDRLRKNQFLNHHGLVLVGSQNITPFFPNPQLALRTSHYDSRHKKSHQFEVIGFSQSYNDEGCKQTIKKQYKAARESFELAIQMDPKFHIVYVNLAMLNIIEGKIQEALETLSHIEALTKNCPYTYLTKGICYSLKQNNDLAIRNIQQSIKLNSNESIFYITLGDLFYKEHQTELAYSFWKKATLSVEYNHLIQYRFRAQHFDKINVDYWISPEYLCLR